MHSVFHGSVRHITLPALRKAESGGSTFTAEQPVVGASFLGLGEQGGGFSHLLLGLHLPSEEEDHHQPGSLIAAARGALQSFAVWY